MTTKSKSRAARKAQPETPQLAAEYAQRFGSLVRQYREKLRMRQDDLALTTGFGRRFIIELEAGKPSVQLGKALVVATAVGLRPFDLMEIDASDNALLPDLADEDESGG